MNVKHKALHQKGLAAKALASAKFAKANQSDMDALIQCSLANEFGINPLKQDSTPWQFIHREVSKRLQQQSTQN
jgi:hypothetical protein